MYNWVEKEKYYGWDIYDGLFSPNTNKIVNPLFRLLVVQLNKYSPINFRTTIGIEKGIDLKGQALFAEAYSKLYKISNNNHYLNSLERATSNILDCSLLDLHGSHCWASHYYPYGSFENKLSPTTPDIIGTCHAIIALLNSYLITGNQNEYTAAKDAVEFVMNNYLVEVGGSSFFKYTNSETPAYIVLNASAQAIEAISFYCKVSGDRKYINECINVVKCIVESQNDDGSWNYSNFFDGGCKRTQIDFHQGYIIDGLLSYLQNVEQNTEVECSINKAVDFYFKEQFRIDGSSFYRLPFQYPIDIHNQAQGIITFSKLIQLRNDFSVFSHKIMEWTIKNMQHKTGFFFYQKWPLVINKIPYMRWGQAWMMLALATYLESVDIHEQ